MKILVRLTAKGENESDRGLLTGLRGEIESIMPRFSTVTVKWDNGAWGRYHPKDMKFHIIGYEN